MTVKQWLAIRKEAGRKIDPKTAQRYLDVCSGSRPYGVDPEIPVECEQFGQGLLLLSSRQRHLGLVWRFAQVDRKALWKM